MWNVLDRRSGCCIAAALGPGPLRKPDRRTPGFRHAECRDRKGPSAWPCEPALTHKIREFAGHASRQIQRTDLPMADRRPLEHGVQVLRGPDSARPALLRKPLPSGLYPSRQQGGVTDSAARLNALAPENRLIGGKRACVVRSGASLAWRSLPSGPLSTAIRAAGRTSESAPP